VNARIKRVFIGMTDPNPNICGRGVQRLMNQGVEVDFFDLDLVRQIMDANRDFIAYYEAAKRTEPGSSEPFEGPSRKELEVVERASLDDLSHEALSRYLAQRQMDIRVPSGKLWQMMERAGYVGRSEGGKLAPTVAGIVLFASEPAELLPQCRVSIEARKAGRTVPGDFEGPLITFRDHIEKFFKEQMRHFTEIRELYGRHTKSWMRSEHVSVARPSGRAGASGSHALPDGRATDTLHILVCRTYRSRPGG
jgi:ATP-dependent DNA helicase RecG